MTAPNSIPRHTFTSVINKTSVYDIFSMTAPNNSNPDIHLLQWSMFSVGCKLWQSMWYDKLLPCPGKHGHCHCLIPQQWQSSDAPSHGWPPRHDRLGSTAVQAQSESDTGSQSWNRTDSNYMLHRTTQYNSEHIQSFYAHEHTECACICTVAHTHLKLSTKADQLKTPINFALLGCYKL